MGMCACPPSIRGSFAAWFTIWSKAGNMRDATWNSTTGRIPARAAPFANPVKAASEIGMSSTRSGANASSSPAVSGRIRPRMFSPMTKTVGSSLIAWCSASLRAWT